jgi:hypothetical protein
MATQVQPLPKISFSEYQKRRSAVDSALGTTLAEGVSPGPQVLALSERYLAGEITLLQFGSLVRAMSGL